MKINDHVIQLTGFHGTMTSGECYMGNGHNINYYSRLSNFNQLFMQNDGSAKQFVNIEFIFDLIND